MYMKYQTGYIGIKVILGRVRVTIVAVKKQLILHTQNVYLQP